MKISRRWSIEWLTVPLWEGVATPTPEMGQSGVRLLSQTDDNDDDDDHEDDDDDDDDDGFFSRLEVSERQRLREIDFAYAVVQHLLRLPGSKSKLIFDGHANPKV